MNVYIGADHKGFQLKEKLKIYLEGKGHQVMDLGNHLYDENDDYSLFARKVAENVASDCKDGRIESFGIVMCGSGAGVDIVANKIDGVRSVLAASTEQTRLARRDDNVNVLALAADFLTEGQAEDIIDEFLRTPFDGLQKHQRRIDDITEIEKDN